MARRRAKNSTRRNRMLKTQRLERSRRAEEYSGAGRARAFGVRGASIEPGREQRTRRHRQRKGLTVPADNSWSGRVTITPPLTWQECKLTPGVEDVRLDLREEDGPLGKIVTAVAVLPARASNSWSSHTGGDLQAIIDANPGHEFAGHLQVDWSSAYGSGLLAERWTVVGRTVVHEEGRLVWRREGGE